MATPLYLTNYSTYGLNLSGFEPATVDFRLSPETGVGQTAQGATVDGPTAGVPLQHSGGYTKVWISPPLAANATISGTIRKYLWGYESSMSANAGFDVLIERCDSLGNVISTIQRSEYGTELTTGAGANDWSTGSVTSTDLKRGDRIKLTVFANDVGTMNAGYWVYVLFGGGSGYDSFIEFTETLDFSALPAPTTKFYFRNEAADSDLSGDVDKALELTPGSSAVAKATNTVAGPTSGIQVTDGAGGTSIVWWSKPLNAISIPVDSIITINLWGLQSNAAPNCLFRVRIDHTDNAGTSILHNFGDGSNPSEFSTSALADKFYFRVSSAFDTADGDRIRVIVFIDDVPSVGTMASGYTATFRYGYDVANTADSWIGFEEEITEQSGTTISPSAIASTETFGTPTIAKGGVSVQPSAISSAQVVGSHTLRPTNNIVVTGIGSSQALGNPTVLHGTATISPSAIASAETFGTDILIPGNVNVSPSAIASAEAIGAHTLATTAPAQTVVPTAIDSAEAFGTTTLVHGGVNVVPTAIAPAEIFGTTTLVHGGVLVVPTGIASSESVGAPVLIKGTATVAPVAVPSAETFGTAILVHGWVQIVVTGIASQESVGNPTLAVSGGPSTIVVSEIGSAEAVGTPTLKATANVLPGAITSAEGLGTPTLHSSATIAPTGITSGEVLGNPTLLPGSVTIQPSGITSAEKVGTPALISGAGVVLPAGIGSAESVGNPILIAGGVTIAPTGIGSAQAFGTAVLKPTAIIAPVAIASAEIFGDRTRLNPIQIPSIGSAEAFGSPTFVAGIPGVQTILPSAIPSAEAIGNPTLLHGNVVISPNAIASGEVFGAATLGSSVRVIPTAIPSQEVVSQPVLQALSSISPTSVGSGEALGQPTIRPGLVVISPQGVVSGEILGDPFISTGQIVVRPSGITSGELLGLPELIYFSAIIPEGLASEEVFGFPELIPGVTFILPTAIDSAEMVGVPLLTGSRASWRWLNRAHNWVTTRGARDPDVQDGFARTRKDEGDT